MEDIRQRYDVIVVGTGAAGLFCALNLPTDFDVLMITKDKLENSDSYLAQGGICCMSDENDFLPFYEDTMKAGRYENNPKAVSEMIKGSGEIIKKLIDFGVEFDRDENGNLDFTREGGHSTFRILHHKDITGKEIVTKLIKNACERKNITIKEYVTMTDLIVAGNECRGISVVNQHGENVLIHSKSVVLATGGLGGLFSMSTNFPHITGDSFAIALKHNVKLENISYIQIHPTALYSTKPGRRFLISESVRGEGAKLYNEDGKRFVDELLPRDVVAGAIREEMLKFNTDHVYLSFEDIPEEKIFNHFPNIYNKCLEEGYDITKEKIPVTPAQHYIMGGIEADTDGVTSMRNLYAVGETACNGVHGANRLASNSLLESLVFAKNAAKRISGASEADMSASEERCEEYKDRESFEKQNREAVLSEIKKQGEQFYEKWSNL